MLKKFCHWIFGLCAFAGFIFMIGTAGASDCNSIDFRQIVIQSLIALALILIGYIGLKLSDWEYID